MSNSINLIVQVLILCLVLFASISAQTGLEPEVFPQSPVFEKSGLTNEMLTYHAGGFMSGMGDIVIRDTIAFCSMHEGLLILDISDVTKPSVISNLFLTDNWPTDIKVEGNFAYLTTWNAVFFIIDVSDLSTPEVIGKYDTPTAAHGIDIEDTLAYIAYGKSGQGQGLLILDINDPSHIELVANKQFTGYGSQSMDKVEVADGFAYVIGGGRLLWILDVSDPASPVTITVYINDYYPLGLVIVDTILYLADHDITFPAGRSAFSIFNVADRTNPQLVSRWPLYEAVYDVWVHDKTAYVANCWQGVQIFDISDPTDLDSIGRYVNPGWAVRVVGNDSLLYVVDIDNGGGLKSSGSERELSMGDFQIVDVRDRTDPQLAGYYDVPPHIEGILAHDGYVYAIYDDETPESGILVGKINGSGLDSIGTYQTMGYPYSGIFVGDTLYLAAGSEGLEVIDVSDPANLHCVRNYSASRGVDVAVRGDFAYLASGNSGLLVFDITRPDDIPVATISTLGNAGAVRLYDDFMYVSDGSAGVKIFEISNPVSPEYAGEIANGSVYDMEISGSKLYVEFNADYFIYELSFDPRNPSFLGQFNDIGGWHDVVFEGDYAIVASWQYGTAIFNISDPENVYQVFGVYMPWQPETVAADGDYIYVAGLYGVVAYEKGIFTDTEEDIPESLPAEFILGQNYPNPFNLQTIIEFELPVRTQTTLTVYDILGRKVRVLLDEIMPSGWHTVNWDGLDSKGRVVSSGIYFYEIKAEGVRESRKMVLVK